MNRDEMEGKGTEMKGKLKKGAGEVTGNDELRREGVADEAAGETQETWGRGKRKVGETLEDAGERLKDD